MVAKTVKGKGVGEREDLGTDLERTVCAVFGMV